MEYKNYLIESDGSFGMKVIKPLSRGSVHKSLRGRYTSAAEAIKAIDFLEAQTKKGQKNGEATNTN